LNENIDYMCNPLAAWFEFSISNIYLLFYLFSNK
jgi:hypothetical protein